MQTARIERHNLRDAVREAVLQGIISGRFVSDHSIGEAALALELGVSRTPVREALLGLERDAFVRSEPGRGFIVLPLSSTEATEVYALIWALECLALHESSPLSDSFIAALHDLNSKFARATDPMSLVQADIAWHYQLISRYSNKRLLSTLETLKRTTMRYECVFMKDSALQQRSFAQHKEIADLLLTNQSGAIQALEQHWRDGLSALLDKIDDVHSEGNNARPS